ncbi:ABC transporter ATP-binding protein [candidate division KSB1 bacterium]
MKSLLQLLPYLKKYKKGIVSGFFFILGANVFTTLAPKVMGYAIDSLSSNFTRNELLMYAGLLVGVTIVQGVFRFAMRYTVIGISRKTEYDLRNDFFRSLQYQPQEYFDKTKTGDLISRATNDLNAVRMVLGPGIMYLCNTVVLFTIALTYMLRINVMLTVIALIPFPVLAFLINRFGVRIHKWFEKIQAQMSTISARSQENLSGIRIVKAYTREKSEIDSFEKLNRDYISLNQRLIKTWSLFYPTIQLISGFGFALVLWYGGRNVISGSITLGDFVAFNVLLLMLLWPIISVGWVVNIFQRGSASMNRINSIMNSAPTVTDEKANPAITDIGGEIEIRNLSFSYETESQQVLKNINIKIPKGSTAAIIGATGSGKSTIVNLIPRVYDPPDGSVFIDGHDVKTIPLEILRRSIGVVPQETFLFSDTIKENINYGVEDDSEEQLFEAVTVSQLKENIESFPDKYDTMLGERGINLSGGQKQRAAISRAIIRDPKILILDDALSSVDTKTEEDILLQLKDILKPRTSIIISHRISTIKEADRIFVIEEGELAEQGDHESLLEQDGIYAGLYRKQLLTEELEKESD